MNDEVVEEKRQTGYIVLRLDETNDGSGPSPYPTLSVWNADGAERRPEPIMAHSRDAAIRAITERHPEHAAGTWLAIPERSFQAVRIETKTVQVEEREEIGLDFVGEVPPTDTDTVA